MIKEHTSLQLLGDEGMQFYESGSLGDDAEALCRNQADCLMSRSLVSPLMMSLKQRTLSSSPSINTERMSVMKISITDGTPESINTK